MNALELARGAERRLVLPASRGVLTERLFSALLGYDEEPLEAAQVETPASPLNDDDLQLALYVAYELHYSAIEGVDPEWEWAPALIGFRGALEREFLAGLDALGFGDEPLDTTSAIGEALQQIVAADDGPPLSRFAETRATREQMLEHVVHRSAYQLKEADPHSWAIPRLNGPAKAALIEIQFDEYGEGRPERIHAELFAGTMRAMGLDDRYGAYLGWLPGITLATVNLMSMFGLHRTRRGALVGHLAGFEMTSSIPNRRYGNALRRLGYGRDATAFYDEHVEADAVHENIAAWDLAGGLASAEPALAADIVYGVRALLALEGLWATHLLSCWEAGRSSLLLPFAGL